MLIRKRFFFLVSVAALAVLLYQSGAVLNAGGGSSRRGPSSRGLGTNAGTGSASVPTNDPATIPARMEAQGLQPGEEYLLDTAFVTMAAGDTNGRLAVALVQSLRNVKTRVPNIVVMLSRGGLGSKDCNNNEWKKSMNRSHIDCTKTETIAEEIISGKYVEVLRKLGAQVQVIDMIPDTPYTVIPGGRQIFWGMAFNKLRVFELTQFRKVIWLDGDVMVQKNIDHLMREPMFTAAITYDCCNGNSPAKTSGGLWVVEPSAKIFAEMMDLISKPLPGTKDGVWHFGDMQVVRYLFGAPPPPNTPQPYWPSIEDGRHGYVEGLEILPEVKAMSSAQFQDYVRGRVPADKRDVAGFRNSTWDGKNPPHVWKALGVQYDHCVGMCECLPGRDAADDFFSVHFSCIQKLGKPSHYETEHDFMFAIYNYATSCTRRYYMKWYENYSKAAGRLPEPHWTGPLVPMYDAKHDEFVIKKRAEDKM